MRRLFPVLMLALLAFTLSSCVRDRGPQPYYPQRYTYTEEFDNDAHNWAFADAANLAYGVVSNGTYKLDYNDNLSEAYYVSKTVNFNRYDDFTIYTRIGSDNNMGLLFGDNSATGAFGYTFTVDYNGNYALYDEGGNGYGPDIQTLVAPATGNFVNRNGGWNELRLEQRGNRWVGYVNEVQVFDIAAQQLQGTNAGFMVTSNTRGEADYLQVDWLQ